MLDDRLQRRELEDALHQLLKPIHDLLPRGFAPRREFLAPLALHDVQSVLDAVAHDVGKRLRAVVLELEEREGLLVGLLQRHAPDQEVVAVEWQRDLHAVLSGREVNTHLLVAAARASTRHDDLRVALGQEPLRLVLTELDLGYEGRQE